MDQRLRRPSARDKADRTGHCRVGQGDGDVRRVNAQDTIANPLPERGNSPPRFRSILFPNPRDPIPERAPSPEFFADLNLDQIVAAITRGKDEYDLEPFFRLPLRDRDDIAFRQEVMRDLERPDLFRAIGAFANSIRTMREHLEEAEDLRYRHQKERWLLDAADVYGDSVARLADDLSRTAPASRGLSAFAEHLTRLVASDRFVSLRRQTKRLARDLAEVRYTALINGGRVEVRRHGDEPDYSAEIEATFDKFRQNTVDPVTFRFSDSPEMNHVEAAILDQVVKLYPHVFAGLEAYAASWQDFADPMVIRFDREIQFYIACLEHVERLSKAGLSFCYPEVDESRKNVHNRNGFDLALAERLLEENAVPVCNHFYLEGQERIIVVTGPNQGGKTTFARTFGQLHYLASLGCPVPGTKAQLLLFDHLFTHFEREENIANFHGKLEDDLVRLRAILERATPRSIVILNEIFTSTTSRDAGALSRKIAGKLMELDLLCVWVTFLDELTCLGEKTVSMVSTVVPENPAVRTFRIVRRPADGLAHALSIAEKYRLTSAAIRERIRS